MAETTRTFTIDIPPAKREAKASYNSKNEGQAQAGYLVTNMRSFTVRGVGNAVALDTAGQGWVKVAGDKEKDFQPSQAQTVQLDILIPAQTPEGVYKFRLVEANTSDPGVDYTEADAVNVNWKPKPPPPPRDIKLLFAIAALVLLAIGTGMFFLFRTHKVLVPDVVRKSVDTAEADLKAVGLIPKAGPTTREGDADAGTVLHVSPEAGTKVAPGTEVTLTIQDVKQITIHSYRGKNKEIAKAAFEALGLPVNEVPTSQGTGDIGTVLAQDPGNDGDVVVAPGSTINLSVKGPPDPIPVPAIIGTDWLSQGKALMDTAHVSCNLTYVVTGRHAHGQVTAASVVPPNTVVPGVSVNVSIEGAVVPLDVVGALQPGAEVSLRRAGFIPQYADGLPIASGVGSTVLSTVPAAGTPAKYGSTVRLYFRRRVIVPPQQVYVPPPGLRIRQIQPH